MPTLRTVEYHLACSHCGYDLYTIAYEATCPECGFLLMLSLCDAAERAKGITVGLMSNAPPAALGVLAANTTHTLDGVMFFWYALRFSTEATRGPNDSPVVPGRHQVSARRLCLAIRDLAFVEFGASANDRLAQWKLATRQDVATFVEDMIRFDVMKKSADDSMTDFASPDCPDPSVPNVV